jgi:DNA-binding GntR family transcriptional regulator
MSGSPLVDRAYKEIRHKLLNGEYLPGSLLSESELALGLNMSRTPIRDAIRLLEKEGFVQTLTKRGIRVSTVEVKELCDMFDLLTALYLFALEVVEQYQIKVEMETMKHHYMRVVQASEQHNNREYYENGMLIMRILLESIHNSSILNTFDAYKDKILFFAVGHRTYQSSNRPYTGIKGYGDFLNCMSAGDYRGARKSILDKKWYIRDELIRSIGL